MKFLVLILFCIISILGPDAVQARWLSTETGRFTTMDTFPGDQQEPISLHKYVYAEDDPVDNDDPSGNDAEVSDNFSINVGSITGINGLLATSIGVGVLASESTPLSTEPNSQSGRLLTAAIFAESTTGLKESGLEKTGIGATLYNDCFYAKLPPGGKQRRNYNAPYFGDGTVIGALQTAFKLSYLHNRWNLVATATDLRPVDTLNKTLKAGDRLHFNLCVSAANQITFPMSVSQFSDRRPVAFNKASNNPPSSREQYIGQAGKTTFYGFKAGREYQ